MKNYSKIFKGNLSFFLFLFLSIALPTYSQDITLEEAPLSHFGQPVYLNGANVAWVNFGFDVGQVDSTSDQLRNEFQEIANYGGEFCEVVASCKRLIFS